MHLRHDAALVSGEIIALVHRLAQKIGGHQKATVGRIQLYPNLVNVIAERAVLTIDLRNTDQSQLDGRGAGAYRLACSARPRWGRIDLDPAASHASSRSRFRPRSSRWWR
jgi:hypothetical protein